MIYRPQRHDWLACQERLLAAAGHSLGAAIVYCCALIIVCATILPSYAGERPHQTVSASDPQRAQMAPQAVPRQTAVQARLDPQRDRQPEPSGDGVAPSEERAPKTPHKTVVARASWYGPGFNGKRTATGERFSQSKLTAAAKDLPLGSKVKVTNLDNGRSTVVKVNDCGPYKHGRKIDLSKRAAEKLGMVHKGEATVKAKVLSKPPGATDCES